MKYQKDPALIEKTSFEIISEKLGDREFNPDNADIIKRVIHTTADFDYADNLKFSEGAVEKALKAIEEGAVIVTDTNMGRSGINSANLQSNGCEVRCFMADKDVAEEASKRGITRAAVSMERAASIQGNVIFAIGNAPTALIRIYELFNEGKINPALVIGVPVGFVNVVEAKELIMNSDIPFIVSAGNKGGSNVAAAVCNAILKKAKGGKGKLKEGFTTGTSAAIATLAAAKMALSGIRVKKESVVTPSGKLIEAEIRDSSLSGGRAKCAVKKDAGDDPDVTDGILIYSEVILKDTPGISIDGGEGIGRATKPGLFVSPGEAAINEVPGRMIREAAEAVFDEYGFNGGADIIISAPGGEEIAKKTFNPRLGIEGGISILGSSGIVRPMSNDAILDTIKLEIRVRRESGADRIFITPGNIGSSFLSKMGIRTDETVISSNFIGEALDYAYEAGFKEIILAGHPGKLIKVAGGIMNTHSKNADCRMEILIANTLEFTEDLKVLKKIKDSITTVEAFKILEEKGILKDVMDRIGEKILFYMGNRLNNPEDLKLRVILFTEEGGIYEDKHSGSGTR